MGVGQLEQEKLDDEVDPVPKSTGGAPSSISNLVLFEIAWLLDVIWRSSMNVSIT